MTPSTLETLKETIQTLTPRQKRELRTWWDAQEIIEPAPLTEDEIEQKLFEAGIIRRPPPPITDLTPYQSRKMLEVQGEPLSETIIRERR